MEARPEGSILFVNNVDKPGMVGAVGTVLAEENINIGGITFGREDKGGLVVCVVNVDNEIPDMVVEKLKKTKDILFAKFIKV